MGKRVVWLVLALCLCTAPFPARATEIDVGVTAALAHGTHQERSGNSTVPAIPVPLITLRVPMKRFELFAEGVPPVGPVPYRGVMPGVSQSTLLSYMHASLRYRVAPHFSIGAGETIYNQATTYSRTSVYHGYFGCPGCAVTPVTITDERTQVDASRVPGMRLEVLSEWAAGKNGWLAIDIAVTPSMHAVVHTNDEMHTTMVPRPPFGVFGSFKYSYSLPETGSQVDGSLTAGHRFGPYSLVYGLRYINYIAHFDRTGTLADRNTLLLPFVGFERAIGR